MYADKHALQHALFFPNSLIGLACAHFVQFLSMGKKTYFDCQNIGNYHASLKRTWRCRGRFDLPGRGMSLPLNPEMLQAAYDFLRICPPFLRWNLPDGEEVRFKVIKDQALRGSYRRDRLGRHVISISAASIGFTESLMETMAHEAIHLHEAMTGLETAAQHGRAFHKFADQVCRIHGFDRKLF